MMRHLSKMETESSRSRGTMLRIGSLIFSPSASLPITRSWRENNTKRTLSKCLSMFPSVITPIIIIITIIVILIRRILIVTVWNIEPATKTSDDTHHHHHHPHHSSTVSICLLHSKVRKRALTPKPWHHQHTAKTM